MKANCLGMCAVLAAVAASGCGDVVTEGRGPVTAVVTNLVASSGAEPDKISGTLDSDVVTLVKKTINGVEVRVPTIFSDGATATINVDLKNPASPTEPTTTSQVTFTRFRVEFFRTDGRNQPGVDVPYGYDSAVTVTAAPGLEGKAGFELIRHTAKTEAPLVALATNFQMITTICKVTFYGKDHAGNDVIAIGQMGVTFGNFGDPD
jgi:hypothetical protein